MKPMTTREAWLYLAKCWDDAKKPEIGAFGAIVAGHHRDGLCGSIIALESEEIITLSQSDEMCAPVRAMPRMPNSEYCWPNNAVGAKARAKFCRDQAAKLLGAGETEG